MKTLLLSITLLGAMSLTVAQSEEGSLYENAEKAFVSKNFEEYVKLGGRFVQFSRDPDILFKLATAYTHVSSPQDALKILHELADKRLIFNLEADPVFQKLNGLDEYEKVKAKFKVNARLIDKSDTAFVLSDPYLIPEGIAVDPKTGIFYISSLAKEKVLIKSGNKPERDFIKTKQDGIWATLGMKVNPATNQLWVCSSAEFGPEHGSSGIFSFDVKSGALKRKKTLDQKNGKHLFNDLTFDKRNTIYFTDSKAGKLYRLKAEGELEELLSTFIYPNGIALDEKGENLFVADYTGITRIYLPTFKAQLMTSTKTEWLGGVDGLYYYNGSLIAIQGVGGPENDRIVKMKIDAPNAVVTEVEILQTFRSDFRLPTTGTIYQDHFYYIANSYVRNLNPDGSVKHETEPMNTIILKLPLK